MSDTPISKRDLADQHTRLQRLSDELSALLSCQTWDISTFFDRAINKVLPILHREKTLQYFYKEAQKINEDLRKQKGKVLKQLHRLRQELNLDEKIPFLKYCNSTLHRSLAFHDDRCIQDIFSWIASLGRNLEELSTEEDELFFSLCHWKWLESRSYPIGEHPAISLALFLNVISQYKILKEVEPNVISPIFRSDYAKGLRTKAKNAVQNLIQELPLIRSWGDFSHDRRKCREKAKQYANAEWERDAQLYKRDVSRRVHQRLLEEGYSVSDSTVYKYVEHEAPIS
jgi:hypothetical protein